MKQKLLIAGAGVLALFILLIIIGFLLGDETETTTTSTNTAPTNTETEQPRERVDITAFELWETKANQVAFNIEGDNAKEKDLYITGYISEVADGSIELCGNKESYDLFIENPFIDNITEACILASISIKGTSIGTQRSAVIGDAATFLCRGGYDLDIFDLPDVNDCRVVK